MDRRALEERSQLSRIAMLSPPDTDRNEVICKELAGVSDSSLTYVYFLLVYLSPCPLESCFKILGDLSCDYPRIVHVHHVNIWGNVASPFFELGKGACS